MMAFKSDCSPCRLVKNAHVLVRFTEGNDVPLRHINRLGL
jgi:hypothetical protein